MWRNFHTARQDRPTCHRPAPKPHPIGGCHEKVAFDGCCAWRGISVDASLVRQRKHLLSHSLHQRPALLHHHTLLPTPLLLPPNTLRSQPGLCLERRLPSVPLCPKLQHLHELQLSQPLLSRPTLSHSPCLCPTLRLLLIAATPHPTHRGLLLRRNPSKRITPPLPAQTPCSPCTS